MINNKTTTQAEANPRQPGYSSYILGFCLSIVLTLAAFFLVIGQVLSGWGLIVAIAVLALAQLAVQLIFFLHLGTAANKKWNLVILIFTAFIVFIIVAGSLWIMYNLNYHHLRANNSGSQNLDLQNQKGF